ncbi:tRNA 2-thiouridine(34) synthase MnmA [Corynebacterium freneyi]|uniref:tRNA-specific 2-thiouridylase MnmA n=1 Tax=Corynebacterium freneyi DNF00450 TaxID=1287475 RepID=A0A095Z9E9_9CORY|nr:tRNA 2-thiouridine(34) synthase MnmA [Corynebacterium freneyi]KGF15332.1 thiouridylase [Corynebacterium freneyi DNF00450]
MRVLAAMSGGVDSAVAAARLVDAGHDVVGVHLALAKDPVTLRAGARGCCSLEDSGDARRVADLLGIPFYVWDFSERFRAEVVDDFIDSYARGETPNPCLRCNERIKFQALLDRGLALGFDAVATGHYALVDADGRLRRAGDPAKDQSYVLGVLDRHQLSRSLFPIGDTEKPQIRAEAAARGIAIANKPDSTDICFIPDGDTQAFLGRHIPRRPGAVVDGVTGEKLADHGGVDAFTIGQRKGLGLPGPAADGKPRYVTGVDAGTGTVTVGRREDLDVRVLNVDRAVWLYDDAGVEAGGPPAEFAAEVQVRAHGRPVPCTVSWTGAVDAAGTGGAFTCVLAEPLRGVAPGQAAVLYRPDADGDIVLGSGTIASTAKEGDR